MKYKTALFISFLFIFSIIATASIQLSSAALDNVKAGDTIYYKVDKYNFPLSDLVQNQSSQIDFSKVNVDLSGSTIGVKIMQIDSSSGTYLLNSFFILGKSITIPYPQDIQSNISDILGSSLTIPSGTGISLGVTLPGSNLVSFMSTGKNLGIPVYIEPTQTANYKSKLTLLALPLSLVGQSLNVTDGSNTFQVSYGTHNSTMSLTINMDWYKTGSNAGLFKSFVLTGFMKKSDGATVNVDFGFSFNKRENNPLPTEIVNKQTQTLSIDNIGLDISWNGTLFNELFSGFNQSTYNLVRFAILSLKGQDFLKYNIYDVQGLFYSATPSFLNPITNSFENGNATWFNGFTGSPTYYNTTCMQDLSCNATSSVLSSITPALAPAISPDWTVWQANMKTIGFILATFTSAMPSQSAAGQLLKYGLTINDFSSVSQLRQSGDFKYFYDSLSTQGSYDASQVSSANRPSNFDGSEKVSLDLASDAWSAYSNVGLLAGFGVKLNGSISLTNIPINTTTRGTGSLTFGLVLKLKNNAFSSLPDGETASVVGTSSGLPGFEFLPVLMVFIAIPILLKRKRVI